MKSSRQWVAVSAAILVLGLAGAPVHAQIAVGEKKVTVSLKDLPLRAAIDALFAGMGY